MRGSSLARQQRLVRLLDQGAGLSIPRTASDLGCTERTVYRDLVVLQEIGVPVYQEREGKRLRWRLVDGPRRRLSVTLSFADEPALSVGGMTASLRSPRAGMNRHGQLYRGPAKTSHNDAFSS